MRARRMTWQTIPCLILLLCLGLMGQSYAYWSSTGRVTLKERTGSFDNRFREENAVTELLDPEGEAVQELSAEILTGKNGKSTEIRLTEGIPAELLQEGYRLRISCPVEEKSAEALPADADFSEEGERIFLYPEQMYLSVNGELYRLPSVKAPFRKKLSFRGFPETKREGEEFLAVLTLVPEEEGLLTEFPAQLEISEKELSQCRQEPSGFTEDGVFISYSFETDFLLDQAVTEEEEEEA